MIDRKRLRQAFRVGFRDATTVQTFIGLTPSIPTDNTRLSPPEPDAHCVAVAFDSSPG
jgi:hypothetical protein